MKLLTDNELNNIERVALRHSIGTTPSEALQLVTEVRRLLKVARRCEKLEAVAEAAGIVIDEAHEETPGYCPLQDALSVLEADEDDGLSKERDAAVARAEKAEDFIETAVVILEEYEKVKARAEKAEARVSKLLAVAEAAKELAASMHDPGDTPQHADVYSLKNGNVRDLLTALAALEKT